jgi:glycosyltransferase involved in cell wall biosynthesis
LTYVALERALGSLARVVVCVSHHDDEIAGGFNIAKHRRLVIHNGVRDIPAGMRADVAGTPMNVVMVARFDDQKDHGTMLRAVAQVPDIAVTLVGDGPGRDGAERLAQTLGIAGRVRFLGLRHDVHAVLSEAQAYALISNWEGLPRSILEAMRAGLPIVASDVGGVDELVDDEIGFLVPRADVDLVGASLASLAGDVGLRQRMGAMARQRYESRHTMARLLHDTVAVYETVLERRLDCPDDRSVLMLRTIEPPAGSSDLEAADRG